MRFCLTCRYFSGHGPICTHCGRSFGGRLCNSKKRHLNPPDALFCGHCGTTDLTDATTSVPLGCSGRMLVLATFAGLLWGVIRWGQQGFTAITGFKSPIVWAIEKSAHVLIILFVFYFLSMFMPGAAGEQFRGLISKLCLQSLNFAFKIAGGLLKGTGKGLLRLLEGEKEKTKAEKTKH